MEKFVKTEQRCNATVGGILWNDSHTRWAFDNIRLKALRLRNRFPYGVSVYIFQKDLRWEEETLLRSIRCLSSMTRQNRTIIRYGRVDTNHLKNSHRSRRFYKTTSAKKKFHVPKNRNISTTTLWKIHVFNKSVHGGVFGSVYTRTLGEHPRRICSVR